MPVLGGDEWATMKEIQELGGHLTISQAARYMHLSRSHKSTASEHMAQWKPAPDTEGPKQPPEQPPAAKAPSTPGDLGEANRFKLLRVGGAP